ncbi:MAG: diheme cytochrome c [Burkholderiales bacterium]|nr:diheme cytochrome c [Burkholderiales bacterium]
MNLRPSSRAAATTLAALAALAALMSTPAGAGERTGLPADVPAAYAQECASCHIAYPPGLLPRESWRRVMSSLGRHYGTDASLDGALQRQIEAWLVAHAGTSRKVVREAPPEDRITRSAWFEREHRAVNAQTWRLPSVKSAANCGACHPGADQSDFDDDRLRLPEGLSGAERRRWRD